MTQESGTTVPNKFQNSEMLKSLESLVDETLQIYEFNTEEETTVGEVCETVAMMLTQMKASITISPALLGPNNTIKRAVLGQDGHIMVAYRDDEIEYKKLTDCRSSALMDILNDIFPKLKDAATEYKKSLEERLSVYRTANKQMKKIDQALSEAEKTGADELVDSFQISHATK